MNKWIAEFELEDGDTMPEHMDLEYKGVRIDFHCKPLEQAPCDDWCDVPSDEMTLGQARQAVKDLRKKLMEHLEQGPRKGYWISHREHCENLGVIPSGLGAYEWCSNCDCGIDVREWHRNNYNFCPNCGTDMREVEV